MGGAQGGDGGECGSTRAATGITITITITMTMTMTITQCYYYHYYTILLLVVCSSESLNVCTRSPRGREDAAT